QRVCNGETEIIMTMGTEHDALGLGDALAHRPKERGVLGGRRVSDRVGEIDRGGPFRDCDRYDLAQEIEITARRVFRRELHVAGVSARAPDRGARPLDACGATDAQLLLEMEVGGRDEDMDPLE